ncbi:MAG TPA: GNAT family N-acetyltransferase [Candidatus Kapabacteria bacterium]|nr:GNAT family N-acetyltransferase [Candidatus Kapabacteria bacterium]
MPTHEPYRHRLLRSLDGFLELEGEWEDAAAASACPQPPTTVPAWTYGELRRYENRRDLRMLAVWCGDRLVAVFPHFVERRRGRGVRIRGVCEIVPLFIVSASHQHAVQVVRALRAEYRRAVFDLVQIDFGWEAARAFIGAMDAEGARVTKRLTHENVMVDLRHGWDAFNAGLSANTREGLRKARRRLRVDAASAVVRCHHSGPDLERGIEAMLRVDAGSWKVDRGGAMCRSDREDVQFSHAMQRLARNGAVRLFVLEVEAEPVAFIIAFVMERTAYFAIWTYADHAAHFMPGKVIMAEALQRLAAEGVEMVDFWGRNDRFKSSWSRESVPRHRVRIELRPGAAERMSVAAAAILQALGAPLRPLLYGSPERYRLRKDMPGPLERRLLLPAARLAAAGRDRRRARCVQVHAYSHAASEGVTALRATTLDRFHLRVAVADCPGELIAFRSGGGLLGAVALEPSPGRRALRVTYLRILDREAFSWPACVGALSRLLPDLRRLYLPAELEAAVRGCSQPRSEHPAERSFAAQEVP